MSYFCLSAKSGVFLFCLSSSCVLYTQCCQFLWIVHILIVTSVFSIFKIFNTYILLVVKVIKIWNSYFRINGHLNRYKFDPFFPDVLLCFYGIHNSFNNFINSIARVMKDEKASPVSSMTPVPKSKAKWRNIDSQCLFGNVVNHLWYLMVGLIYDV